MDDVIYEKQLNSFFKALQLKPLSAKAIALYAELLHIKYIKSRTGYGRLDFLYWFAVPDSVIRKTCKLSASALQCARYELIEKGYIQYSKDISRQLGKYRIVDLIAYAEQ